ncbi:hypothetical protein [Solitalea agri]|nr:hypothetical protein [Solitalea agri]
MNDDQKKSALVTQRTSFDLGYEEKFIFGRLIDFGIVFGFGALPACAYPANLQQTIFDDPLLK